MLIASFRHRPEDLRIWRELETADRLRVNRADFRSRHAESMNAVLAFTDQPCYAGVSWGKDSVVIAHLLWQCGRHVPLMHLRPTNHNADCDAVRDAFFARWRGQSYAEIVVDYSQVDRTQPDHVIDRETDAAWYAAIRKFGRPFDGRHILGIRAGESAGRRIRTMRWGLSSPNGCAPIARWTTEDVFGYLAHYDLPVHPAYACLGNGRWPRERLRVAEIGDTHGKGSGRREWEAEYYPDLLRRIDQH